MRKRVAVLDIAGEALPLVSILMDAGLTIEGSTHGVGRRNVRLIVSGDVLPDDCANGQLLAVKATFESERYGSQSLSRVKSFEIVGRALSAPEAA